MTIDISKIQPGDKVTLAPLEVLSTDDKTGLIYVCDYLDGATFDADQIAAHHPAPRASDPAVAVLQAEVSGLKAALEDCGRQFQFYADLHAEAGKHEKAEVNRRFAEMCRAITAPPKEVG